MTIETIPHNRTLTCDGKIRWRTRLRATWAVAFHQPAQCDKCCSGRVFEVYACEEHWHAGHGLREPLP